MPISTLAEDVIEKLLSNNEFSSSPEYVRLIGTGEDLPGIVCSAYGTFLARLIKSDLGQDADKLNLHVEPVNDLARWHNLVIDKMLQQELFESLEDENCLEEIRLLFDIELKALLDTWELQ